MKKIALAFSLLVVLTLASASISFFAADNQLPPIARHDDASGGPEHAHKIARPSSAGAQPYEVGIQRDLEATMRDGVVLRADAYRPKSDEKFPVLMQRTPYNKRGADDDAHDLASHGYVVVVQDVRGRFSSDGDFYPVKNEGADGYDSVEWAAALPGSNGKVGMYGGSYLGMAQLQAAMMRPPHLAGLYVEMTPSDFHEGCVYQGGALEQWLAESWATGMAADNAQRRARQSDPKQWTRMLPLASYPIADVGTKDDWAPYFKDYLAHPSMDDFWRQWNVEGNYDKIAVPVYTVAAWYDIFLGGSLRNYLGLKKHAYTEEARRNQRLMVMVGGHSGFGPKIGEVEFPGSKLNLLEELVRWFDWMLKGVENGMATQKPVKVYVMGKNEWRAEDDWPLVRSQATRYYLGSGRKANSASGDGTLGTQASQGEAFDRFTYDPADPAPTHGGPLCCGPWMQPGALNQRDVESRPDVLVYTTPAFEREVEVTGPVTLELFVSSSARDTDFTAKLVDVWPNGFAQNLTEGMLRMRYCTSQEKPELMRPGQIYEVTVDLWATSNVFLAGHKLRLEVSSSNFPRFDRNMNTGRDQARETRWVKAINTVYHDTQHPSALLLPLVDQR